MVEHVPITVEGGMNGGARAHHCGRRNGGARAHHRGRRNEWWSTCPSLWKEE